MKKLLLATTALCAVVGIHATAPINPPINLAFGETGAWPTDTMQLTSGFDSFIKHDGMINEMARGEMLLGDTVVVVAKHQVDKDLIEAPTKDYYIAEMAPNLAIVGAHLDADVLSNAKSPKAYDLASMTVMSTDAPPIAKRTMPEVIDDSYTPAFIAAAMADKPDGDGVYARIAGRSTTALTMEVA